METKQCVRCHRDLPYDAYSPSQWSGGGKWCRECKRTYNHARYQRDPEAVLVRNRQWKERNPEKALAATEAWRQSERGRRSILKNRLKPFGLTIEQYEEMSSRGCHACGAFPQATHKWNRRLHVDHDHSTGRTRGLLCPGCNAALGLLEENHDRIIGLARYAEEVCQPLTAGSV